MSQSKLKLMPNQNQNVHAMRLSFYKRKDGFIVRIFSWYDKIAKKITDFKLATVKREKEKKIEKRLLWVTPLKLNNKLAFYQS